MQWFKKKRIVVPFDFSSESLEAVKVAVSLADSHGDVHVFHAVPDLTVVDPTAMWDALDDGQRTEDACKSIREKLAHLDIEGVQVDVAVGSPAPMIAELAHEMDAGLIIIPSHGRTGVKRLLLGSVAERVVRLARCSVLVLKDGEPD